MLDSTPKTLEFQLVARAGGATPVTVVSIEDADLAQISWCKFIVRGRIYARHVYVEDGKQKALFLHRIVLERVLGRRLEPHERPDHVDNNPLNNTRSNLRLATVAQNSYNQGKPPQNTSGYKGVYFNKTAGRWQAQIQTNGVRKTLGLFDTPEEAHEAYKKSALEMHGEFARFE